MVTATPGGSSRMGGGGLGFCSRVYCCSRRVHCCSTADSATIMLRCVTPSGPSSCAHPMSLTALPMPTVSVSSSASAAVCLAEYLVMLDSVAVSAALAAASSRSCVRDRPACE
jgi:hypothetical protein